MVQGSNPSLSAINQKGLPVGWPFLVYGGESDLDENPVRQIRLRGEFRRRSAAKAPAGSERLKGRSDQSLARSPKGHYRRSCKLR